MQNICITEEVLFNHINVILFNLWDPLCMNQYCPRTKPSNAPADEIDDDDDIIVIKLDPNAPSRLQMGISDDEYKSYAEYLVCILPDQPTVREIYAYLRHVEVNLMSGSGDKAVTRDVAHRLYAIGQGITLVPTAT